MSKKKKIAFIDAQKMAKENPDTFFVPSTDELNEIKEGSLVKIAVDGERFWVEVIIVSNDRIAGKVGSYLIMTDEHGLNFDDKVAFEKKHVYSIFPHPVN